MTKNRSFMEQVVINRGYERLKLPAIRLLYNYIMTADFLYFLLENFPERINEYKDYPIQIKENEMDKSIELFKNDEIGIMEQKVEENDKQMELIDTDFISKKYYGEMTPNQKNRFSRQVRAKMKH